MNAWRHGADVARVDEGTRRVLLNLERLDQPPVVLEGAAVVIHDKIDGTRDTNEIIARLREDHPGVHDLPQQVRDCLDQLEATGVIRQLPSTDGAR